MTRRIALTGGIATGKSHVRAQFAARGVPTIDADVLARQAVEPGSPGLTAIVARFGSDVIDISGALDRRKLGALVFADAAARHDLEQIIHPGVRQAIDSWFAVLDDAHQRLGIADIPLLYETGRENQFDTVIVAACEPATQLQRVMARDGVSEEEALQRIRAQLPIEDKIRRADHVIRTDGSIEETNAQVAQLLELLKRS